MPLLQRRISSAALTFVLLFASLGATAADHVEANRLEYRLADLEQRASDLLVTQVTLRQQVLDAGPELSRKVCDQIAPRLGSPQELEYLRGRVKELEKREHRKNLSVAQLERLAQVKRRITQLEEDSSMDCKALAPLNP